MADVLEGGPAERPRRSHRRTAAGLAATALVGLGAWAVVSAHGRVPVPAATPTATPVAIATPSPSTWPSSPGSCGSEAQVVQRPAAPARAAVPLRLLVGGAGVRAVDGVTGRVTALTGVAHDVEVNALGRGPDATWAFGSAGCTFERLRAYRLQASSAVLLDVPEGDGELLAGPHGAWRVTSGAQGAAGPTRAFPLAGGRALELDPAVHPVADTTAGLVATSGGGSEQAPQVVLLDTSGRQRRVLGTGDPLGASDSGVVVLTDGRCGYGLDQQVCHLTAVDAATGRTTARTALPAQRLPASAAAVDSTGRLAAFVLSRTYPDPRYVSGHPMPPGDVAVLDLSSGDLELVPDLVVPPKTGVGLAVDAATGWVVMAVSDGDRVQVLGWRPGQPAVVSVAELTGAVSAAPPVLLDARTTGAGPAAPVVLQR